MTKRHIALLALVLACFAGAMIMLVWSTEQSRQRSMINIERICDQLEQVTGEECQLQRPPRGIADGQRQSSNARSLSAGVKPICPIVGSTTRKYHTMDSPYRRMVSLPAPCFTSVEGAREAGFRAPG